ncbi:AraC-like DNA-binding protein [Brevibacterium sanguinis]|uniref:AraC-like DNA-binding protein n=2 Tax=Brevibacterium TaxID=1696 RepID=A0A366IJZ7_9MICO|nr:MULTISPECIES: helix-turn-helix transcriptional regulator [Brevibacterium]RBP64249.1 AraC-like DNA-binding protein [Brevibacterium sanguinis]RBP71459.1 AraC-like DNA-binding protein [Brevibacterium celere]
MDLLIDHVPAAPLRHVVLSAVGYRASPLPGGVHRGLPSLGATLVVELAGPLRVSGDFGRVAAHGVLAGLHTRPVAIDADREQEGLQYALSPWGLRALARASPAELCNHSLDLAEVLGTPGARLVERLHGTADWGERFRLLDDALIALLIRDVPPLRPEVGEAWRLIAASSGRLTISEVAARVGWGRRHLSEQFRQVTGLTPKEAARIARFTAARDLLRTSARPSLADIAAVCGYSDHSHLSREWRSLAGVSARTWMREELPFLQDADGPTAADWVP